MCALLLVEGGEFYSDGYGEFYPDEICDVCPDEFGINGIVS